jgi:hypothetical protein
MQSGKQSNEEPLYFFCFSVKRDESHSKAGEEESSGCRTRGCLEKNVYRTSGAADPPCVKKGDIPLDKGERRYYFLPHVVP